MRRNIYGHGTQTIAPTFSLLGALKTAAIVLVGGYIVFTLLLKVGLLLVFGLHES